MTTIRNASPFECREHGLEHLVLQSESEWSSRYRLLFHSHVYDSLRGMGIDPETLPSRESWLAEVWEDPGKTSFEQSANHWAEGR